MIKADLKQQQKSNLAFKSQSKTQLENKSLPRSGAGSGKKQFLFNSILICFPHKCISLFIENKGIIFFFYLFINVDSN